MIEFRANKTDLSTYLHRPCILFAYERRLYRGKKISETGWKK